MVNYKIKKICAVIGSRANYASLKSLMKYLRDSSDFELQVICCASAVEDRYGSVINFMKDDGFHINFSLNTLTLGDGTLNMVKTTSQSLNDVAVALNNLKPDYTLIVGDRYEVMSFAIASSYMNIPVIHTMGGEITGTIDESIRHAITKLSHVHFVSTLQSKINVVQMGEDPNYVHNVGCPRIDEVNNILQEEIDFASYVNSVGVGNEIDFDKPFVLVSQHPVTTEVECSEANMQETLKAVEMFGSQAIILWPNSDAGTDEASRAIRKYRESNPQITCRFVKNLPMRYYIKLMQSCACLVGNSSSGIREGAFIGTPCVDIGTRQSHREVANNVVRCGNDHLEILSAIKLQSKKNFDSSTLYGSGDSSARILNVLRKIETPSPQKTFLERHNRSSLDLVIFDLDGVLVDACDWHRQALNMALLEICNYEISLKDHYSQFNGIPTKEKLKKLTQMGVVPESKHQLINTRKQNLTLQLIKQHAHYRQEKVNLIKKLKSSGAFVACYTNSIRKTAELMLSKTGVLENIDYLLTNEDVANNKPDPEGYLLLVDKFKVVKDKVIIVEDSPKGLEAARRSGCQVLQVDNPDSVNESLFKEYLK